MTKPLLTAQQVAERLNLTVSWFYRNREDLEAEGFPKRLPGFRRGRWSAEAIDAWVAAESEPDKPKHPVQTELTAAEAQRIRELVKPPEVSVEIEVTDPIREIARNLLRSRGQKIAKRHGGQA